MDRPRFSPWVAWPVAYVATLVLSAGVGALTPLGAGNAVFLAGALCVFASVGHIRLGGERTVVGRSVQGVPQWGLDPEKRRKEIRRGAGLFLMGLALWVALGVAWLVK